MLEPIPKEAALFEENVAVPLNYWYGAGREVLIESDASESKTRSAGLKGGATPRGSR